MIKIVNKRIVFLKKRCIVISYIRLLMNDSTRAYKHRMGLTDTKVCECNQAVEDKYHFFFECVQYNNITKELQETVQKTWLEAGCTGSLHWSVALILAPQYFISSVTNSVKPSCLQLSHTFSNRASSGL